MCQDPPGLLQAFPISGLFTDHYKLQYTSSHLKCIKSMIVMRTKLWENPSSTTLSVTSRTWIKRPRTRRTLPQHCEKVNPPELDLLRSTMSFETSSLRIWRKQTQRPFWNMFGLFPLKSDVPCDLLLWDLKQFAWRFVDMPVRYSSQCDFAAWI